MKKKTNFLLVVLLLLCIAAFIGYRALDAMRTDSRAPEIQIGDQIPEISVNDPEEALLQGIHATDDRDGDVTGSVVVENKVSQFDVNPFIMTDNDHSDVLFNTCSAVVILFLISECFARHFSNLSFNS